MSAEISQPTQVLLLKDFPVAILEKIEEAATARAPRTTRNNLIEWVLAEFAEGRLVPVSTIEGKEAA